MRATETDLAWIERFVDRIRPHVRVRLTDGVVIRMPNEAFKVNRTAARVLNHLLQGGRLRDILRARADDASLPAQLESFFCDLSAMLGGRIGDSHRSTSLERVPFKLGYIERPVLSEIALTWRCNVKCRFCYAACEEAIAGDEAGRRAELDTEGIMGVLRIIRREAEVPSVSFTGGEPCLRSDLVDLVEYSHGELGMRVNLITNGTLIDARLARDLKKAGLSSAQVSLESPDPEVHDLLVGAKGAFEASVAGLKALKDAGVSVHPHTTLCGLNRSSLARMPGLAKSLGITRCSANLIIPAGRGADQDLAVRYEEVPPILEEVMSAARKHKVRFLWYSPTPVCLFNPIPHGLGNKGCSACEGLLSIDPFGRLLPCSSWKEPVGNLLDQGFQALWFGERGRWLREKRFANPACNGCAHFALCNGACPLYFRVHGYRELAPFLPRFEERCAL